MLETRSHYNYTRDEFATRKLAQPEEAQVMPPFHLLPHPPIVATERNDEAYSLLLQTTMEPLPHGLLVLSSSKPLTDRTGQAEGRFSYWKHQETQPVPQEYSTGQGLVS